MQESANKKKPESIVGESDRQDYQTSEINEISSLTTDLTLPEIKLKLGTDTVFSITAGVGPTAELPEKISIADHLFTIREPEDSYKNNPWG